MTAPEWRAPPDTMREDPPYIGRHMAPVGDEQSAPQLTEDTRAHLVQWVRTFLGAGSEWAKDRRAHPFDDGNWIFLVAGSEWVCALVRDLNLGRFRVVRVVPMPEGGNVDR